MFKKVERSATIGTFNPAFLTKMHLATPMPALSPEFEAAQKDKDKEERSDFWNVVTLIAMPAAAAVGALLALLMPLPH
jgi:hypothetical protein